MSTREGLMEQLRRGYSDDPWHGPSILDLIKDLPAGRRRYLRFTLASHDFRDSASYNGVAAGGRSAPAGQQSAASGRGRLARARPFGSVVGGNKGRFGGVVRGVTCGTEGIARGTTYQTSRVGTRSPARCRCNQWGDGPGRHSTQCVSRRANRPDS